MGGSTVRLQGKTAVITGAASGMGRSMVDLFLREGCRIAATDVDREGLDRLGQECEGYEGRLLCMEHDVTVEEQCRRVMEETAAWAGNLSILITNPWWQPFKNVVDTTTEDWRRTMGVTLDGVYYCCKYAVPLMAAGGGGSIVNNGSVRGLGVAANSAAYNAAKAAVSHLTKSIAMDFGPQGIRANCLCPGIIATRPTIESIPSSEHWQRAAEHPMLKRIGTPEEAAYAALFLASDESSYVTAVDLVVDGGLMGQIN